MPSKQLSQTAKVGRGGTVTIPAKLRKKFGITEGSTVIAEERDDGILIRPADTPPVEIYTPERIAQFILSNAVNSEDYVRAREEVRAMGFDPDSIIHEKPA